MRYIYVCNWKMVLLSYEQQARFFTQLQKRVALCAADALPLIIFSPSFVHLARVNICIQEIDPRGTFLAVAGQDCSQFYEGAFTGDTSALFLKESGCSYCIVGHVERRLYYKEDDECVARKLTQLAATRITPIICIGATQDETVHEACIRISRQLLFYREHAQKVGLEKILFAYEPYSSVGKKVMYTKEELAVLMEYIHHEAALLFKNKEIHCLYGGGVDEDSIEMLKTIPFIDGFLIGRASIDFQKLEKIIF
jgi:triosephosphate isomerase